MSLVDLPELLRMRCDIKSEAKGGTETMVYDVDLIRDIFAYTIVRQLDAYGCSVFGGFVRSHYSGKALNASASSRSSPTSRRLSCSYHN